MNHEELVARCKQVHGNKYTYPRRYVYPVQRLTIECPHHGEFKRTVEHHLNGNGCATCRKDKTLITKYPTKEKFIKKAISIHGNRYDYDPTDYMDYPALITIYCIACEYYFKRTRFDHITGRRGCPRCTEPQMEVKPTGKKVQRFSYHRITYISELKIVNIHCDRCGCEMSMSPQDYFEDSYFKLECCSLTRVLQHY